MSEAVPRAVCYRCDKPQSMCLCARVPRIDNRTSVFVLQHPRERAHPIGTARFASLGLSRSRVDVAWNAGAIEDSAPSWLPPNTALLYPSDDARDLHDVAPHERPEHLIVIDGTWHTARTLYRDKKWLHALPHFRFSPEEPSRYRLRREPQADFVSTIEAIAYALRLLEPQTQGLDGLLQAFDAMIDDQAEHVARRTGRRSGKKKRPLAHRSLPHALIDDFAHLVIVYAESLRPSADAARELLQVSAIALGNGARFDCLLKPQSTPGQLALEYMLLTPDEVAQGCDLDDFRTRWTEFLHGLGSPLLCAWNQSTLDLLASHTGTEASRLSLKSAYRGVHGVAERGLDQVISKEGLRPAPLPMRGRAARRLANAVAIAQHMHTQAVGEKP